MMPPRYRHPKEMSREDLFAYMADLCRNWLAHDGLWFLAVERAHGMEEAIELDRQAWEEFTRIEARRIMKRLGIEEGEGLDALDAALRFRLYAHINVQTIERPEPDLLVFTMNACRVQDARKRKGLPDFPCKPVGMVEYGNFADTIDPRIETKCVFCPPDDHPEDAWCRWEFRLRPRPGGEA